MAASDANSYEHKTKTSLQASQGGGAERATFRRWRGPGAKRSTHRDDDHSIDIT